MLTYAQQDQAHKQNIHKEKWLPSNINQEFHEGTNPELIKRNYGIDKTPEENFRLSKTELKKLISEQADAPEINKSTRLLTPLERESELVWKDRQHKKDQKVRHENLVMGRVGTFAFDNQTFQQIEERFRQNLQNRKTHIVNGAI